MSSAVIYSDTLVGKNVIINTGVTIDHDCIMNDCVHISLECHLCGNVSIGYGSFIGVGSAVTPGVKVGSEVFVVAGSTVVQDISDNQRVAGTPARAL